MEETVSGQRLIPQIRTSFMPNRNTRMVRFDRKSGEAIDIRPEPAKGENTFKWYWILLLSALIQIQDFIQPQKEFSEVMTK